LGIGGALALWGAYDVGFKSEGERAYEVFESEAARGASQESLVANTEFHLERLAERERRNRHFGGVLSMIFAGMGAFTTVALAVEDARRPSGAGVTPSYLVFTGVISALAFGGGWWLYHDPSPTERLLDLYHRDPGLNLRFGIAPTPSGASFA